jgi:hypothetical protein
VNCQSLVAKVWNFAPAPPDQGVSYQACILLLSGIMA